MCLALTAAAVQQGWARETQSEHLRGRLKLLGRTEHAFPGRPK